MLGEHSKSAAVTVAITAADYRGFGAVTEALPAGLDCASSDLDDEEVQAAGQEVRFTLQWASPSPYIVNGSSEKGAYSFSRMRRGSGRKDTPAGDASYLPGFAAAMPDSDVGFFKVLH